MGSGDGDAGSDQLVCRPTLLRFFDISTPPPRMHGAMADGEGWLLAAALAGATRAFLSPWRHHALLRDAPRSGRRPGAKSRRRDRGQLDSPLCGGPGSVYLLRGVYVSSTGSWSPPILWRPLGRAASLGPTAHRPWFVGGQLPSVVQNAGHRSWPRRDQALPEARRPFLPAGSRLSPPPSALMRISSSQGDGVLVNGDRDGPFRH